MLSSALPGPALALLALANLSLANMPHCATPGGRTVTVGICGQPGQIDIPLDGSSPRPRQDCATPCHALCELKKAASAGRRIRTFT